MAIAQKPAAATPSATGFRWNQKWIGGILGVVIALVVWFLPLSGLAIEGRHGLALILWAVTWWVTGVTQDAVTGLLIVTLVIGLRVLPPASLLKDWTGATMWYILASFAFGVALSKTQLAKRLGLTVLRYFGRSFFGLALSFVVLNLLFSVLGISASFPRVAITFGLVESIGATLGLAKGSRTMAGLALAAAMALQGPATVLYTGNVLNPLAAGLAKVQMTYFEWAKLMAVPGLVLTAVTLLATYYLFKPKEKMYITKEKASEEIAKLGPMSAAEWRTTALVVIAIALWATESIHHIAPGFVALFIAVLMMFPGIGVLTFKQYTDSVSWNIVFFVTATFGIGQIADATGLSKWLGSVSMAI